MKALRTFDVQCYGKLKNQKRPVRKKGEEENANTRKEWSEGTDQVFGGGGRWVSWIKKQGPTIMPYRPPVSEPPQGSAAVGHVDNLRVVRGAIGEKDGRIESNQTLKSLKNQKGRGKRIGLSLFKKETILHTTQQTSLGGSMPRGMGKTERSL